jgi:hypothetical protein
MQFENRFARATTSELYSFGYEMHYSVKKLELLYIILASE